MEHAIDTIYGNGIFRPRQSNIIGISEGKHIRITANDETKPESVKLATCMYDGLFDKDIDEIKQITFNQRISLAQEV